MGLEYPYSDLSSKLISGPIGAYQPWSAFVGRSNSAYIGLGYLLEWPALARSTA